jgi:hypothetical protein
MWLHHEMMLEHDLKPWLEHVIAREVNVDHQFTIIWSRITPIASPALTRYVIQYDRSYISKHS